MMRVHLFVTPETIDEDNPIMYQDRATANDMQALYDGCTEIAKSLEQEHGPMSLGIHLLDDQEVMTEQRCSLKDLEAYLNQHGKLPTNLLDAFDYEKTR